MFLCSYVSYVAYALAYALGDHAESKDYSRRSPAERRSDGVVASAEYRIADFAWEVLQFQSTSSKLARRYCTCETVFFFSASTQLLSLHNISQREAATFVYVSHICEAN